MDKPTDPTKFTLPSGMVVHDPDYKLSWDSRCQKCGGPLMWIPPPFGKGFECAFPQEHKPSFLRRLLGS